MTFPQSSHLAVGTGTQVGIITLWTKKEHVMKHVSEEQYAVISQLYSRDEGISALVRSLLVHPTIRDIIIVGADLNNCAQTLFALWKNGAENGQVIGAPGYLDTEIPLDALHRVREHVTLHDKREEKDYAALSEYIATIEHKPAWGEPETYAKQAITPPSEFPTAHQHSVRADSIEQATTELAHLLGRFGNLRNVHIHLTQHGKLPERFVEEEHAYTENLFSHEEGTYGYHLHKDHRLQKFQTTLNKNEYAIMTFGDDEQKPLLELIQGFHASEKLHIAVHTTKTTLEEFPLLAAGLFSLLDELAAELHRETGTVTITLGILSSSRVDEQLRERPHVLRRTGDPRSNILIRLADGRLHISHLSPGGKRLEEFTAETAMEAYKRLVVEHRLTDLSHAAYIGYELGKAEFALKTGGMYEQDA